MAGSKNTVIDPRNSLQDIARHRLLFTFRDKRSTPVQSLGVSESLLEDAATARRVPIVVLPAAVRFYASHVVDHKHYKLRLFLYYNI